MNAVIYTLKDESLRDTVLEESTEATLDLYQATHRIKSRAKTDLTLIQSLERRTESPTIRSGDVIAVEGSRFYLIFPGIYRRMGYWVAPAPSSDGV